MKGLATGAALVAAFLLANVVAGGVYLVLWPVAGGLGKGDTYDVIAIVMIGALAAACAVFFFKGFMSCAPAWFQIRRRRN